MAEKITDYISGQEVTATREEVEAIQAMSRQLVEDYGYPKSHIQTRPQYRVKKAPSDKKKSYPVDIAVFNSSVKNESSISIIVECKRKDRKEGIDQLEDYLRFSRANIGVWYNGDDRVFLRKIEHAGTVSFQHIPNIPRFGQRVEDIGQYKRQDLIPPTNLQVVFRSIRSYLAGNAVGATRDEAFAQQIINLIFCKIYDETYTKKDEMVDFRAGIGEDCDTVQTRILLLFAKVRDQYSEVLDEHDEITLDASTITYIVGELQNYCITEATRDAVAEAFETFIGHALKGSQGQFFTPRNIVKLLVEIIDPSAKDTIIDPACGSGGFLVECLRHIWSQLDTDAIAYGWAEATLSEQKRNVAMKRISGIDKDNFLSKVTKVYMTLLGDGKGGIFCEDSLAPEEDWDANTRSRIGLGKYDVLVTNPPFGKDIQITGEKKLAQFELARKVSGSGHKKSVRPEVLFIERSLQFLKKGGMMGIVLPETFFHAPNSRYIMDFLKKGNNIRWIIDLPHNTFRPHNNAKCIAIILQKDVPQEKGIHFAVAEQMGHDHKGKEMFRYDPISQKVDKTRLWDDISSILEELHGEREKYVFSVPNKVCEDAEIYVPRYYWKAVKDEIEERATKENWSLVPINDLITQGKISFFDGHGSPKAEYKGRGSYPYVRVKDIVNWEIYKDPTAKVPDHVFHTMVSSKKRIQESDVLFVKRASYRIGSVAMASKFDSDCLLTREILVLRTNKYHADSFSPYYLLYLLSHRLVQMQIFSKVLIETTLPNIGDRWRDLKLPVHRDNDAREKVSQQVERAIQSKWKAINLLHELQAEHGELTT